jgi:hypothetical protein
MAWALANGYVVFTHDLDFGTMLALTDASGPSVLQVRAQSVLPEYIGPVVIGGRRCRSAGRGHHPGTRRCRAGTGPHSDEGCHGRLRARRAPRRDLAAVAAGNKDKAARRRSSPNGVVRSRTTTATFRIDCPRHGRCHRFPFARSEVAMSAPSWFSNGLPFVGKTAVAEPDSYTGSGRFMFPFNDGRSKRGHRGTRRVGRTK